MGSGVSQTTARAGTDAVCVIKVNVFTGTAGVPPANDPSRAKSPCQGLLRASALVAGGTPAVPVEALTHSGLEVIPAARLEFPRARAFRDLHADGSILDFANAR